MWNMWTCGMWFIFLAHGLHQFYGLQWISLEQQVSAIDILATCLCQPANFTEAETVHLNVSGGLERTQWLMFNFCCSDICLAIKIWQGRYILFPDVICLWHIKDAYRILCYISQWESKTMKWFVQLTSGTTNIHIIVVSGGFFKLFH